MLTSCMTHLWSRVEMLLQLQYLLKPLNWGNKEMVKAIEWIYVGSLMALRIMIILSWERFCWLYMFSLPCAETMGYKQTYMWHSLHFIPVKSVHNGSRGISPLAKKGSRNYIVLLEPWMIDLPAQRFIPCCYWCHCRSQENLFQGRHWVEVHFKYMGIMSF